MIGGMEIIIVAVVILVIFGGAALPKFFRSLGQAKSEFEKGKKESLKDDVEEPSTNSKEDK